MKKTTNCISKEEYLINCYLCSTWEVINSPVDTFSEMLARPGLTSDQVRKPGSRIGSKT